MNQIRRLLFSLVLICTPMSMVWADELEVPEHSILQEKFNHSDPQKRPMRRRHLKKTINMYFDGEDIIDIINLLAAEKEANIILPTGANALNTKVTLHLEEKVTIDEAWDILYTLLDIAGYSMIAKEDTFTIVRTTKDISREALPLYIVKPEELPDTDKRIRYIYYFTNLKISEDPNNEILAILKSVLPDGTITPGAAYYKLDAQSNSLILSDKANDIKAAMKIVHALDQIEAQEKPEIIQLRYLPAEVVASLFNEQILRTATDANQARLGVRVTNNSTYFKRVRIVPDARTNRLIVFGRPQAIERVRDFINKNIDVEVESGNSILHVYQLQYLDAKRFAPILDRILKSERSGGTEQSKAAATTGGGVERYFDQVIVKADQPETISGEQSGSDMQGSNNLIIAARNDDYTRIKKLIEELDVPQPLVIIEVLIADLTISDIISLGSSLRNPLGTGLPNNVNFQSAQATDFVANTVTNPSTIQADLLRRGFNAAGQLVPTCDNPGDGSIGTCFSSAALITGGGNQGTAILALNDAATGQTWGIGQVRKFIDTRKVLSNPHLIAMNNEVAEIKVEEQRLAIDQGSGSTGGTTTQTRKWIPAALSVKITPRISSADTVNLRVDIDINQFDTAASSFNNADPNTANQITRNVRTNANVRNGHVLALGGLTRIDTAIEQLETPLLGKIPIIGWLFKDRTNTTNKNNLTVFISPTIIMPRLRGGVGTYTKNQVQLAKNYSREGMLFDNLRDPITRWFFKSQKDDAETSIDDFLAQDEFIAPTLFDIRSENRRVLTNNKKGTPAKKAEPVVVAKVTKKEPQAVAQTKAAPAQDDLKTLVADAANPFEEVIKKS